MTFFPLSGKLSLLVGWPLTGSGCDWSLSDRCLFGNECVVVDDDDDDDDDSTGYRQATHRQSESISITLG